MGISLVLGGILVANFNRIIFMQNLKFYFSQIIFFIFWAIVYMNSKFPLSCYQHLKIFLCAQFFLFPIAQFPKPPHSKTRTILLLMPLSCSLPHSPFSHFSYLEIFSLNIKIKFKISSSWSSLEWSSSSLGNSCGIALCSVRCDL